MKKITLADVAILEALGVPVNPESPGYVPLAVIALARKVSELQARVAQLENAKAEKPVKTFFSRRPARNG